LAPSLTSHKGEDLIEVGTGVFGPLSVVGPQQPKCERNNPMILEEINEVPSDNENSNK
jgi:hypothetical protein